MQKFLKKKSTLIGLVVATIIMTLLLIVFCVRPVSLGYTYSGDNYSYHFKISKYEKISEVLGAEVKTDGYFFAKDGYLVTVAADDYDDFKQQKENIVDNWGTVGKLHQTMEINAFRIKVGDEVTATCTGAIVTVSIFGVTELALIALTVLSIMATTKKSGSKKKRK